MIRSWLIIPLTLLKRVHVRQIPATGSFPLDTSQSHHLRDVLRMNVGDRVEAFDDGGTTAETTIEHLDEQRVLLRILNIKQASSAAMQLTVAAAIPKGERADWMIEKLSELGVTRFIPLIAARSVVVPSGKNKRDRWLRLASESAKQSRRAGVMQIDEPIDLRELLPTITNALVLSTEPQSNSIPLSSALISVPSSLALLIGPEGGWSDDELSLFRDRNLTAVKLTETILRVETAAVAAASVVLTLQNAAGPQPAPSHS